MKREEIMKIVEDAFDNQISAEGWNDYGTPMANIVGKQDFLKEIAEKLNEKEKVHVCDFCSWKGIVSQMIHTVDDSHDQYDCPECGWLMINNLYKLRKV